MIKKLTQVVLTLAIICGLHIRVNASTTLMNYSYSAVYNTNSSQTMTLSTSTGVVIHNTITAADIPGNLCLQLMVQKWNGSTYVTYLTCSQTYVGSAQWNAVLPAGTYRIHFSSYYYSGGTIYYDMRNCVTGYGYVETSSITYTEPDLLE